MIICIVDDDLFIHSLIKQHLSNINSAYKFISFTDGTEIHAYLLAHQDNAEMLPTIIFLDLNMPVMDGFSFLEKFDGLVKALALKPEIYVVSTVTHSSTIRMIEHDRNVNGFIPKPFKEDAFLCFAKQ